MIIRPILTIAVLGFFVFGAAQADPFATGASPSSAVIQTR